MAIILEANYTKKIGLPRYSSHAFSVSIRAELTDLSQIQQESDRLYGLLQDAVDRSIQQVGFLPEQAVPPAQVAPASRTTNGYSPRRSERTASTNGHSQPRAEWRCSDKQWALLQKIVHEKNLDKAEVDRLATEMFGVGVRQLDRLQASGLIDELFERHGGGTPRGTGRSRPNGNHPVGMAAVAAQARSVSRPPNGGSLL